MCPTPMNCVTHIPPLKTSKNTTHPTSIQRNDPSRITQIIGLGKYRHRAKKIFSETDSSKSSNKKDTSENDPNQIRRMEQMMSQIGQYSAGGAIEVFKNRILGWAIRTQYDKQSESNAAGKSFVGRWCSKSSNRILSWAIPIVYNK